jgi:ATP-dependent DNA helicase RecQ
LRALRKWKTFPILALTATATKKVRTDIVERLGITQNQTFTSGFDRKNLVYIVREITKEAEKNAKVLEIIQKTWWHGIIYCSSVKAVKKVYEFLLEQEVSVWIYTWEMNAEHRENEQNLFMNGDYSVMVATNAFGMWIDKSDIRYVIHYNLPGSIENYYQEAGRAGRDGKTSFSIIIASYQDSIIQEFFIENTYPPKSDILKLYDYLYQWLKIWEWKGTQILKTYNSIAIEADLKSDMKVWSILKIFEKYWVLKRGLDGWENEFEFRWRGITLLLPKQNHDDIPVLWSHQSLLKDESYFKLEQVKKLLFKPGCRKRFILEYFWDAQDLQNLSDNCGMCDYCIDKKKFENSEFKEVIPHNVFFLILELVKKLDDRFGLQILAGVLSGSQEKKILDWNLDKESDFWILEMYTRDLIQAIFEELIQKEYLYKSFGQYPKIGISLKWKEALLKNEILLAENPVMQSSLFMRLQQKWNAHVKPTVKKAGVQKVSIEKIDTYTQTLQLYKEWKTLWEIASIRELWVQTIESHIVKLYEFWKINLWEILTFTMIEKLKKIKDIVAKNNLDTTKLQPIKELCDESITYFDIKIAIALIEKSDL